MRPTTTFLIPNVHIYFVFNLVNTTTNTDKRQQKRMSAIMMITAFKGLLYCRNWDLMDRRLLVWRIFCVFSVWGKLQNIKWTRESD